MRWSWKRWGLISLGFSISLAVILTLYKFEWTGFGQGESVSTTTNKRDIDGNIVETTTTKNEPSKNLWDWLSLLGIPLSLTILGYILQQQERKNTEEKAKEEILQTYFDRLSTLLIDKNILAIAAKVYPPPWKLQRDDQPEITVTPEERELVDSAIDIIQARTLSILRRFEDDVERKTSVILFLIKAEIMIKAKLNFDGANLEGTDLSHNNLELIDLSNTFLSGADLSWSDIEKSNFSCADLSYADLSNTALVVSNLSWSDLIGANLSDADLNGANLSHADLRGANLKGAILFWANLKKIKWDNNTQWPDAAEVARAKNIPEALKQQLGIPSTTEPETPNHA